MRRNMTLVLTNDFPCPSPILWASLRNTVIRVLVCPHRRVARASQEGNLVPTDGYKKVSYRAGSEARLGQHKLPPTTFGIALTRCGLGPKRWLSLWVSSPRAC